MSFHKKLQKKLRITDYLLRITNSNGQSLIELLVAMAVFVIAAASIVFLIIDVYVSDKSGLETSQAAFLAEEGLDQARLTRDNDWDSLVSVPAETIGKFTRNVNVENIDSDRKKVVSQITWDFTQVRPRQVALTAYLTNWQEPIILDCNSACVDAGYISGSCTRRRNCDGVQFGGYGDYGCRRMWICCCFEQGEDITPPADIIDLVLSNPTGYSIDLSWTAPGDDGDTGIASGYDIRYSTSLITESNWNSAVQVSGEPSPSVAGTTESMTVSGLDAQTTYYFAIKTSDEIPNESGLSNVPGLTTLEPADCNTACIDLGHSSGSCSTPNACKNIPLGGLGEYECQSNKLCCCE